MTYSPKDLAKIVIAAEASIRPTATLPHHRCDAENAQPKDYTWHPSFWRTQPLLGIIALALAIVCMLVALAILQASDGDATTNWYFQPTVYLAIATAVSNTALQCALAQAAPVSWWRKALHGSTIKDLELDWEAGHSSPRALARSLKYRRRLSLLSIASLSAALVVIDGPFLQRSSSVKRGTTTYPISLKVSIAPQLPSGFSVNIPQGLRWEYTPAALAVLAAHTKDLPIVSSTYCEGTCRATIRAPGYTQVGCEKQTWTINEAMLRNPHSTWGPRTGFYIAAQQPLLYAYSAPAWSWCDNGREPMNVATGIANYHDCQGSYTFSNCTMIPAVLEYNITIQGNIITYAPPRTVEYPLPDHYCGRSLTYATYGFLSMMIPYVSANGSLGKWDIVPPPRKRPVEALNLQTFTSFSMRYLELTPSNDPCTLITHDPRDDIIAAFNDLMFRSGVSAGSWENATDLIDSPFPVHQVVQADLSKDQNVFHSNISWFLGAAAIEILTILLIMPAYWGWWSIGVEFSLSPFHIGSMLDAPLLRSVNSAAGSTGVLGQMGDTQVKLGVVEATKYGRDAKDEDRSSQNLTRHRLEIAKSHRVETPLKEARFSA